jgi:hypothetical protein
MIQPQLPNLPLGTLPFLVRKSPKFAASTDSQLVMLTLKKLTHSHFKSSQVLSRTLIGDRNRSHPLIDVYPRKSAANQLKCDS